MASRGSRFSPVRQGYAPAVQFQSQSWEVDPAVIPDPWTKEYLEHHRALTDSLLGDPRVVEIFADRRPLPAGYGIGFDERVVEYPWLLGVGPGGRVLDAGSTLNHAHILDRFLPMLDSLTIVTLSPEEVSFPERGVTYVYADLRELPFEDDSFDEVISLSTLEHIGMDNSFYAPDAGRAADPGRELDRAIAELRRVVAAGGRILVTVPYGRAEDHGWLHQLDRAAVQRLIEAFGPAEHEVAVFLYTSDGWCRSDMEEAAGARYRDYHADPSPVEDRAVAARAVACISMRVG